MGVHNLGEAKGSLVSDKYRSASSSSLSASRLISSSMRPWKSRSKSQTRVPFETKSNWITEGQFLWRNSSGHLVVIKGVSLLSVSEIERRELQKLALSRLQDLNLGCPIEIPNSENFPTEQQVKKRTMLLRKKAVTTNFFESKEKDKGSGNCSAAFGVPLTQCISNDQMRLSTDSCTKFKEQRNHCEEVLSALRLTPGQAHHQLIPRMVTRQQVFARGSLPDVFLGDLQVPLVVQACIQFLEDKGLQTLGIFRVSGSQKRVRQLREDWDKSRTSAFVESTQPHDVAQLLKEYFRDLPDPLLTRTLYRAFLATQKLTNEERKLKATRWLLYLLPVAHRDTLATLLAFLQNVSSFADDYQKKDGIWATGNKMDSNNLATVFGPNLLRMSSRSSDSPYSVHNIEKAQERSDIILTVRTLIENGNQLFQVTAEDLHAIYQALLVHDPDLLNAVLTKRLDIQRSEECSEEGSDTQRQNLNLHGASALTKHPSLFGDKEYLDNIESSSSEWNKKSGIRPLIMVKEAEKSTGKHRNQSKERTADGWRLEDRRTSSGSVKGQNQQPYSVTASFTITMAKGVSGVLPQSTYGVASSQDQSRVKPRRIPYGKLRHMTTPAYYTEETITSVTIPSPKNASSSGSSYKTLLPEGLSAWDSNRNRRAYEFSKPRLPTDTHTRSRRGAHDQEPPTNQPMTERWKRQEIIASEHVQI